MKRKKISFLWAGIIAAAVSVMMAYGIFTYEVKSSYQSRQQPVIIEIPYGMSSKQIASLLREKDVIRSRTCFLIYVGLMHHHQHLRAGAFLFPSSVSLEDVVDNLVNENGAARLIRVTIPEGYTIWEMGKVLEKKHVVSYGVFVNYAHHNARNDLAEEFPFLNECPVESIEGYLYPDTYLFSPGSSPKMIMRTMLKTFQVHILKAWNKRRGSLSGAAKELTLHQLLTMASMVEKEAADQYEMPVIASVFYNRIQKKMNLASDPTVVYALGAAHKDKVLYKDLEIQSPYNTYKYPGLPCGPIASPGTAAFEAAMNPVKSPFLFFVADHQGGHIFTKTYAQHLHAQKVKLKKQ